MEDHRAAKDAHGFAVVTKSSEYFSLDLESIRKAMATLAIIDGGNVDDDRAHDCRWFEYRRASRNGAKRTK